MSQSTQKNSLPSYEVIKGTEYLKSADLYDPEQAEELFRRKEMEKQASQKLLDDIKNDNVDIFTLFNDYVILGDSRALGFSYFGFLPYNRVFAGGGDIILTVREHMDKLKKLHPSYIYLCYGVNDAGRNLWDTTEDYIQDVLKVTDELHQMLPDSKILLSSVIWISDGARKRFPKWGRIYDFNIAYRQMCEETDVIFVDNDEICQILKDNQMWSGDGIHLSKSFYKMWAKNLYLAAITED